MFLICLSPVRIKSSSKLLKLILVRLGSGIVGFAVLAYIASFFAFHASSSLSLDTYPLFIAAHSRTASQQSSPPHHHQDILLLLDDTHKPRCSKQSISHGHQQQGEAAVIPCDPEVNDAAYGMLQEFGSRGNGGIAEQEMDLTELVNFTIPEKRQKWLKLHWEHVKILQSNPVSEKFASRLKNFFQGKIKGTKCSLRFFMTWISPAAAFGTRELSCLDSVFNMHPSACVVIVSRSLDSAKGTQIFRPFVKHGYRVLAATPDLPFLFRASPAETWLQDLKKGRVDPGEISFRQNLSNILRLLLLYKYGGIYIDNDVILLKDMSNLTNAIGAQSEDFSGDWNRLNNAVLVFDRGHQLVYRFIEEFARTFNGSKWGHNGPYLVTRVVRRAMMIQQQQQQEINWRVMPKKAFYPVTWGHIPTLFYNHDHDDKSIMDSMERWRYAKLQQLLNESYALHLWNKQSGELEVEEGSIVHALFRSRCVLCFHHHHHHRKKKIAYS